MKTVARVGLGCLLAVLSIAHEVGADFESSSGFDMGLNMGFASYQASLRQPDYQAWNAHKEGFIDPALREAQKALDQLIQSGVLSHSNVIGRTSPASGFPGLHDRIVEVRTRYESEIRARSNDVANAYQLGLLLGLAEGQCTSPNWGNIDSGAWLHARRALEGAKELIATSSLSKLRFDPKLLEGALAHMTWLRNVGDAYDRAKELRLSYGNVVRVSGAASRLRRVPPSRPTERRQP